MRRAGAGESGERRSGQRRETAERRGAGDSGAERDEGSRERQRQRDSIADGTALRNIVGEEVAATFGDTEEKSPGYLVFVLATLLILSSFQKIV